MQLLFTECYKLKEIKGINNFYTNNLYFMRFMFDECYELENIDLSNFDTSLVYNMEGTRTARPAAALTFMDKWTRLSAFLPALRPHNFHITPIGGNNQMILSKNIAKTQDASRSAIGT